METTDSNITPAQTRSETNLRASNPQLSSRSAMDDPSNPYFLHHSDSPGIVLVSHLLTGEDYASWSRAMRIALSAKNKLGFIDGTIPKPAATDMNLLTAWVRNNNMVISWILNSVSRDISASVIFADSAYEIWTDLRDRFLQKNGPRIFQLRRDLVNLLQGQNTVSIYFTKLKSIWEELSNYRPVCTCGLCSCGVVKELNEYFQAEQIMYFLMGLNDSFAQVRDQILVMDPMPPMNKVFSLVAQEEHQRNIGITVNALADPNSSLAYAVKDGDENKTKGQKRERAFCTHCNMQGHTIDKCYKLHGYPPGYKGRQKGSTSSASVNQVSSTVHEISPSDKNTTDQFIQALNPSQYQQLISLLSSHFTVNSKTPVPEHNMITNQTRMVKETEETSSGSPIKQQLEKIDCSADPIPNLPSEIIEKILLRLPVKSLWKFRRVSKSWLSLISSHKFRKSHLKIATNDPDLTFHRIIFDFDTYSVRSLLYGSYEPMTDRVSIGHYFGRYSNFRIHGSCNGLICISSLDREAEYLPEYECLHLWNPSLGESKTLPDVGWNLVRYGSGSYGFGFDETNEDYKVLAIFRPHFNGTGAYVYSLKANSWSTVEGFNIPVSLWGCIIFVQGKLHWSVNTGVKNKWHIAFFDLSNETYGMVEQPNYWEEIFNPRLGVLGGCISMICNSEETGADIWILKDYHVKESWSKFASIPLSCDHSYPLCILPNGDVLFVRGTSLIVYNPNEYSLKFPQIGDVFQSIVYVESLVSPDADGD